MTTTYADAGSARRGRWGNWFLALALLCLASLAHAASPAAGSLVTNQATATFIDGEGLNRSSASNTVQLTVAQVASFTLVANNTLSGTPGATVYFPHILTNTGNGADAFALLLSPASGTLTTLQIFADADGNGLPDNTTPLTGTGTLAAGGVFRFVVAATIPASAPQGSVASLRVDATSGFDPTRTTTGGSPAVPPLTDTVHVVGAATLAIAKQVSVANAQPGDSVGYQVSLRNPGAITVAGGQPVVIDGVAAQPVLIRDLLPANTTLVAITAPTPATTTALYHRVGAALHTYTSLPPSNLVDVDAVGLAMVSLASGASVDLRFTVRVNANAASNGSGAISNAAQGFFQDGVNPVTAVVQSATVVTILPTVSAQIVNYTAPDYATIAPIALLGGTLFLRADAAACNARPDVAETRTALITGPSGESETFTATETGPNTGVFTLPVVPTRQPPVVANDGVVEGNSRDRINVSLQGCGVPIVTQVTLVDPAGVVFNSRTNQPVSGATVTLLRGDGAGGCTTTPASVTQIVNGAIVPALSTVVTAPDGRYTFELVAAGDYCLAVTPPGGLSFPSTVPAGQLPAGRVIDAAGAIRGGSYGGNFNLGPGTVSVTFDVPLDPADNTGLFIQKLASRSVVEIADFLDYSIKVRNNGAVALGTPGVVVSDDLPAGFAYQPGTARVNGQALADPSGGRGPRLAFNIGSLNASAEILLTYRVRVGPGALEGDGTNRARASFNGGVSNLGSARVQVQGGVFSDKGFIVGKVFLDCNRSSVQDDGELGIPGVRIYLEDGTSAVSDSEGKYSFYGLSPLTHVLKLDRTTMPIGSELVALNNRNAGDAGSSFVDLKNGELFKANFAEGSCSAAVLEEVKTRRAKPDPVSGEETERALSQRLEADPRTRPPGDVKAQPASGTLGATTVAPVPGFVPVAPRHDAAPITLGPTSGLIAKLPTVDLEKLLPGMDNSFGFVDLKDRDTLPIAQTNIRIKGAAGSIFHLSVNGTDVPLSRVGKKSVLADQHLQAWEFIGISLKPGPNELRARQLDEFGNERGAASITLIAPDQLGKLEVLLPSAGIADGLSTARVIVKLSDAHGVPVTVRTPITLEASTGVWQVEDLDSREPGVQVFIEGGRGEFLLSAPDTPGETLVRVSSGILQAESRMDFLPNLRPLIAAGVIEGVLNLSKLDTRALVPSRKQDHFEQELNNLSTTSNDGKLQAAARTALFLKGKVKGEYLLTLAYDSDKDTRQRLFRDIQPDEFYPVYGDSSIRRFDAQSTSQLYVRVDKNKSYLLYGDFITQNPTTTRKLGVYSRSLTGAQEHFENQRVAVNAFASRDSTTQIIDEIPANGTSGPYRLTRTDALENSEKVEILVRDRSQPGIVLKTTPQTRFSDYEVEQLTGQIIFRSPIASLDSSFNPQSIRITYEADLGGKEFWVAGVDAQVKLTDRVEVGAIAVRDENPQDKATLVGVNATVKLTEKTFLTGELARTDKASRGTGDAERVELRHEDKDLQAQAYFARTDLAFDNAGSYLSRGRSEAGGKLTYRLNEQTLVRSEVLRTEDLSNQGAREGEYASIERSLTKTLRIEVGLRHGKETGAPANPLSTGTLPNEFTSVKAKLAAQVPWLPEAGVFGEYEQDVQNSDRRIAAIGGDYQIADRGRLYVRHELISSLSGPYALNTSQTQNATVVGLDADYTKNSHVFSEYRVRDAFSGADTEAAIGLRNLWEITKGLRVSTSFERVHVLAGTGIGANTGEAAAVTFGIDYTAEEFWKGSARLDLRTATTSDSVFTTLGIAAKLDRDWTLLGRNALAIMRNKGTVSGERVQDRLQVGVAYRDTTTDVWNALGRFEHRYETDGTQPGLQLDHTVEIVSFNANYQPQPALVLTARAASKWVTDDSNGLHSTYTAHLIGSRATYDLSRRWDLGVIGNTLFSGDGRSQQYGLGMEAGRLLTTNLWLSAGYNFFGFKDDDLAAADYTNQGVFVRLRYKFDEDVFGAKHPATNNSAVTAVSK